IVTVEDVLSPVGDEQIVEAVIVVVAHADATGPAGFQQSGALGNISESSIAVVLEQPIACAGWGVGEAGAGQQKDVEPAVIVEIEKRAAAAQSFDNIFLVIAFAVHRDCS